MGNKIRDEVKKIARGLIDVAQEVEINIASINLPNEEFDINDYYALDLKDIDKRIDDWYKYNSIRREKCEEPEIKEVEMQRFIVADWLFILDITDEEKNYLQVAYYLNEKRELKQRQEDIDKALKYALDKLDDESLKYFVNKLM